MKTKKLSKKLWINKKSISNLNSEEMVNLHGGAASINDESCFEDYQSFLIQTQYDRVTTLLF